MTYDTLLPDVGHLHLRQVTLRTTSGCLTDYELLDERGVVLASSGQECLQSPVAESLDAGGTFRATHVWTLGIRGMPALPAGRYRVRGVLRLSTGDVPSAPIPIEVAAAP